MALLMPLSGPGVCMPENDWCDKYGGAVDWLAVWMSVGACVALLVVLAVISLLCSRFVVRLGSRRCDERRMPGPAERRAGPPTPLA